MVCRVTPGDQDDPIDFVVPSIKGAGQHRIAKQAPANGYKPGRPASSACIQVPGITRQGCTTRRAGAPPAARAFRSARTAPHRGTSPRARMGFFRTSANTQSGVTMRPPAKGCVAGLWQPMQRGGQPCVTARSASRQAAAVGSRAKQI